MAENTNIIPCCINDIDGLYVIQCQGSNRRRRRHGDGTYKYLTYIPYAVLIIIILLLDVLALTTYKIRVFQYRTTVLVALITLGLQIWLGIEFFVNLSSGDDSARMIYKLNVVFPIVCVILDVLAARGILADQLLVESTYRLRTDKKNRKKRS